jgi:hypothetical protein
MKAFGCLAVLERQAQKNSLPNQINIYANKNISKFKTHFSFFSTCEQETQFFLFCLI